MRHSQRIFCVLSVLSLTLVGVQAQTYPSKPITIVAPFSPGGNVDIVARAVAQSLSGVLGLSVLVDNRAGAGGAIGSSYVSKSAPDGYTLLLATTNTISVLPYMMKAPPYKPSDFAAIGLAAVSPLVMVVRADDKRFPNTSALMMLAKTGAKNISVGHSGMGTSNHVSLLRMEDVAKVEFNIIPYKGSTPALTDLMGGQLDFMVDQLSSSKGFVDGGKLKILAVLSKERDDTIPNTPTFFESTKMTLEANTTSGVLAAPDTPAGIVKILNDALVKVAEDPGYKTRLLSVGSIPKSSTPKEWAELLRQESVNSEKLAQAGKLKAE
jgi:tripartite-type tricarboxylate transporter receptor subunit TctC